MTMIWDKLRQIIQEEDEKKEERKACPENKKGDVEVASMDMSSRASWKSKKTRFG